MLRRFTPLKFVDALNFFLEHVWHLSSISELDSATLLCWWRRFDSSYLALTFIVVPNISFLYFTLVWFFSFQMPSPAWFGCVFHCCTVSQSWSPGSRVSLPRAHPIKHCAPAAHSGLICMSLFSETALCFVTSILNFYACLLVVIVVISLLQPLFHALYLKGIRQPFKSWN